MTPHDRFLDHMIRAWESAARLLLDLAIIRLAIHS